MTNKSIFCDVYYNKEKNTFCYRSKYMVYEERFEKGALVSCGWNCAGYPLDVLTNFPSRLDTRRYAEPFAFNLEIDGQSVSYDLDFVSFKKEENDVNWHSKQLFKRTLPQYCELNHIHTPQIYMLKS